MIRFIAAFSIGLAFANPSFASPKPFEYRTECVLVNGGRYEDTCKVIETRNENGQLKSRNIFSNRFGLTVKSWFNPEGQFITWDSHNKNEYGWEYKAEIMEGVTYTMVTTGFYLKDVSWE